MVFSSHMPAPIGAAWAGREDAVLLAVLLAGGLSCGQEATDEEDDTFATTTSTGRCAMSSSLNCI